MAGASDIIAYGFGSWSTVAKVPTHGFGANLQFPDEPDELRLGRANVDFTRVPRSLSIPGEPQVRASRAVTEPRRYPR